MPCTWTTIINGVASLRLQAAKSPSCLSAAAIHCLMDRSAHPSAPLCIAQGDGCSHLVQCHAAAAVHLLLRLCWAAVRGTLRVENHPPAVHMGAASAPGTRPRTRLPGFIRTQSLKTPAAAPCATLALASTPHPKAPAAELLPDPCCSCCHHHHRHLQQQPGTSLLPMLHRSLCLQLGKPTEAVSEPQHRLAQPAHLYCQVAVAHFH